VVRNSILSPQTAGQNCLVL